jgi:hypothetical protein
MTIPPFIAASNDCRAVGVGPIVSLSFVALIDDPDRFSKTSDVGAFLG